MKKKVALCIGVFDGSEPWLAAVKRLGYDIVASHPVNLDAKYYFNNVKEYISDYKKIDYFDFDEQVRFAKEQNVSMTITRPATGDALIATGYINSYFGFKGISYKQALTCSNKEQFHIFLEKNDLCRPNFSSKYIGQIPENFPVIVKPVYGAGGLGVKQINCIKDYQNFFSKKIDGYQLTKKYDYYLVQECVLGKYLGVNGFVKNKQIYIFHKWEGVMNYFGDDFKYAPMYVSTYNKLPKNTYNQIQKLFQNLDLDNCPFMLEMLTDNELNIKSFIECNLRPGGLNTAYTYDKALKTDICETITSLSSSYVDRPVYFEENKNFFFTILSFNFKSGVIKKISIPNLNNNILFFKCNLKIGDVIEPLTNASNSNKNGHCITYGNTKYISVMNAINFWKSIEIEYNH